MSIVRMACEVCLKHNNQYHVFVTIMFSSLLTIKQRILKLGRQCMCSTQKMTNVSPWSSLYNLASIFSQSEAQLLKKTKIAQRQTYLASYTLFIRLIKTTPLLRTPETDVNSIALKVCESSDTWNDILVFTMPRLLHRKYSKDEKQKDCSTRQSKKTLSPTNSRLATSTPTFRKVLSV